MSSTLETSQLEVDRAAGEGNVEVLDSLWQTSEGAVHPGPAGLQMAAAAGMVATLEWARLREIHGFDGLMDIAAWRGRLSALKWLQANRKEGCTVNANIWAARRQDMITGRTKRINSGHLKVLRWLLDTLGQPCTSEALEAATIAGHAHIVAWILRHSKDQTMDTTPAVVAAACNGHVEVLKLLLSASQEEQQKSGWAVTLATDGGHDDCIKLLQEADWPSGSSVAGGAASRWGSPEEGYRACLGGQSKGSSQGEPHLGGGEGVREESRAEEDRREPIAPDVEQRHHTPDEILREATEGQRLQNTGPNTAVSDQIPAELSVRRPSLSQENKARSRPQEANRGVHRVLSLDVALPGTDSAGPPPPSSLELPKGRVRCTAARPPSSASSLNLDGDPSSSSRPVTSRSIHVGRPSAASTDGETFRKGWEEPARGEELRSWGLGGDWEGRPGVADDDGGGDDDDKTRLSAFLEATRALAVGEKSSVRDVWTPVLDAYCPSGVRLSLGGLAKPSRDPVVSAYIEGLLQDHKDSQHTCRIHRCAPEKATKSFREARKSPSCARGVPSHFRSSRLLPFHPVVGCKALRSTLKPPPPEMPLVAHAVATANTRGCTSADAEDTAERPAHSPSTRGRPSLDKKQQVQTRQEQRALSGRCNRRSPAAPTTAGHPVPPAAAPQYPIRAATAPYRTLVSTTTASGTGGRAATASAHFVPVESRAYARDCQGDISRWVRERLDSCAEDFAGSADGRGNGGSSIGRGSVGGDDRASSGRGGNGDSGREGLEGSVASYRRRQWRTWQTLDAQEGSSPRSHPPDRHKDTGDGTFLVCRGWGKPPAPHALAAPKMTRHGATSAQPEHDTSGRSTPAGSPWATDAASPSGSVGMGYFCEEEAVPRGMFLTRRHRCGSGMAPRA